MVKNKVFTFGTKYFTKVEGILFREASGDPHISLGEISLRKYAAIRAASLLKILTD